jgi:hypothetical protein
MEPKKQPDGSAKHGPSPTRTALDEMTKHVAARLSALMLAAGKQLNESLELVSRQSRARTIGNIESSLAEH